MRVIIEPNQAIFRSVGISFSKTQYAVIAISQTVNMTSEIHLSKPISFLPSQNPPENHRMSPIAKQTR